MRQLIDVIIPIAPNDIYALKNSIPYICKYLPVKNIYIIANKSVENEILESHDVHFIDENSMLPGLDFEKIKIIIESIYPKATRRAGWYFQQFLKMGFSLRCDGKYYLVWDSDTLPLKEIIIFNENSSPYLDVIPYVKGDEPYFELIEKLFPTEKIQKFRKESFITEHMLFSTDVMKSLICDIENNKLLEGQSFYEKILRTIPKKYLNLSGFSEFETYASYSRRYYPNLYSVRKWTNLRHGKIFLGNNPTFKQLKWVSQCFNVVSIEDFDAQCFFLKILCDSEWVQNNISFKRIYSIVIPIINIYYGIRMIIRKVVRS